MCNDRDARIKEFVHDLNWINRQLQVFTARVAFLLVARNYTTLKNLNGIPFFERLIDSMYNAALFITGVIFDKRNDAFSLQFLLTRIEKLRLVGSSGIVQVRLLKKKIIGKKYLVEKILNTRHNLFAHSNIVWARRADYNRNVINARPSQRTIALKQLVQDRRAVMVRENDLKELMEFTITIVQEIKNILGAPDKIFSSCRNDQEWKSFFNARITDAERYFEVVATHDWR